MAAPLAVVGNALLAVALAAGAGSLALGALASRFQRASHRAFLVAWSALAGALVLMIVAFLAGDLTLEYVWDHTRTDYPFFYRLAGLWGGQAGTVLLWTFFLATTLLVEKRRVHGSLARPDFVVRASRGSPESRAVDVHRVVHATLLALVVAFVAFMLADGTFRETPASALSSPLGASGRGLQEILLTPLMVIHPPLQFAGYALAAVPAALALAGLATRAPTRAWTTPALAWGRVAWGVATIGLGLGGLWAYYVLSFGGYWAWDPVETSNLLPWLALTAFMHAGKYADKFDDYKLAAPLLAFAALWLTLFATFATRSGLWVSVHAFTDPTANFEPDAMARLLAIMDAHLPTRFFVGLLAALLLVAAALVVRRYALDLGGRAPTIARAYALAAAAGAGFALAAPSAFIGAAFEAGRAIGFGHAAPGFGILVAAAVGAPAVWLYVEQPEPSRRDARDWTRRLMYAGVLVFAVALAVAFVLNLQVVNGFDRGVFDARAPFVALPLALVLTVMLALAPLGKRGAVALAVAGLAAGVAGAFAFRDVWIVALSVPILLAAGVASVAKIAHVNRGAKGRARVAGFLLLASSLLALVMWSNPPSAIPLGIATLRVPWFAAIPMLALATAGLVGAVAALSGVRGRLARAGAVAAALAAGYGVGLPFALVALALLPRRAAARESAPLAPSLRQTGIYVIHLAVAIGLVGYAASTYAITTDEPYLAMSTGTQAPFAGGVVALGEPHGTSEAPVVPLSVTLEGRTTGAEIAFVWKEPPLTHYAQDLRVHRGFFQDVYAAGFGLTFADGSSVDTLEPTPPRAVAEITGVTFELTVLPLMTFVWAGLTLMGVGMGLVLAAGVAGSRAARGS